jgi:hypothetical protein
MWLGLSKRYKHGTGLMGHGNHQICGYASEAKKIFEHWEIPFNDD